jgi:hypothetical protein
MSGNQSHFPVAAPVVPFKQYGQSGTWVSDHFTHLGKMADDIAVIRSMHSDAVNHDPAMIFMQSGAQLPGRPSMGAWVTYGLGSENANLPAYIVLVSKRSFDQPLSSRLWDTGFLPSRYQGVQFRAAKDPVLYLSRPPGVTEAQERAALDAFVQLQKLKLDRAAEEEINSRIQLHEMAFRMQSSIPEVIDTSKEPDSVRALYGPDLEKPGSFAANCLLARRLAERGVRYVQLYHPGWDMHGNCVRDMPLNSGEVDQPAAGLLQDLKNRDMLKDTLVVFLTEFGRTVYCQGKLHTDPVNFGREHHRDCFSIWMAGGGIKGGITYGESDDFGFRTAQNPVHVNDFHATLMHLLGIDHEKFTYRFQGRDYRLTDLAGKVIQGILA